MLLFYIFLLHSQTRNKIKIHEFNYLAYITHKPGMWIHSPWGRERLSEKFSKKNADWIILTQQKLNNVDEKYSSHEASTSVIFHLVLRDISSVI